MTIIEISLVSIAVWNFFAPDMLALSRDTKGQKDLMTVIDIFRLRVSASAINNKSVKESLIVFQQQFKEANRRKPARLQTDAGKDFLNKVQ